MGLGIGVAVHPAFDGGGAPAGPPPDVEHVQNGNFASATGWTTASGWAIAAGQATQSGTGGILFNVLTLPLTSGQSYLFSINVIATNNADDLLIYFNVNGTTVGAQALGSVNTGLGTKTIGPFVATGNWTHLVMSAIPGLTMTIDDVSTIGP